jgi:hypothetical protein
MQHLSCTDLTTQYNRIDLAFFEVMRSVAELHRYEGELSAEEIEQLQLSARVLNGIIARNATTRPSFQLV